MSQPGKLSIQGFYVVRRNIDVDDVRAWGDWGEIARFRCGIAGVPTYPCKAIVKAIVSTKLKWLSFG